MAVVGQSMRELVLWKHTHLSNSHLPPTETQTVLSSTATQSYLPGGNENDSCLVGEIIVIVVPPVDSHWSVPGDFSLSVWNSALNSLGTSFTLC